MFTASINSTIPGINKMEESYTESGEEQTYIERILNTQLAMNGNLIEEKVKQEEVQEQQVAESNQSTESNNINTEIPENAQTEVIEENNIKATYTNEYNGIQIKNSSKYNLTEEMLTPDIELEDTKDIVIFHTHTCESYTPTEAFNYEMTGNCRTTDRNFSVARVGTELTNFLTGYGFNVIHDTTYNDYPAYTGSYDRSLKVVQNVLSQQSSDIVIDLHRDAVGSSNTYGPTVRIGEEYAAQLMFVIGTDGGGLEHPNWQKI